MVEDEMIVAMQIEDVLRDIGCKIIGPVGTLQTALALAQSEALDVAILDINLDGEKTFPVADELRRRSIPFIVATGYGESVLPQEWRDLPRLCKPFRDEQLAKLIEDVCRPLPKYS